MPGKHPPPADVPQSVKTCCLGLPRPGVPALLYMLYFGTYVFYIPYFPLLLEEWGLSRLEIGLVAALQPGLYVVAPLWGLLADVTQAHRAVIMGASLGAALTLGYMAQLDAPAMWLLVTVAVAGNSFGAAVAPLLDNATIQMLDSSEEWGGQRLWGAVGWGGLAPVAGALAQAQGPAVSILTHAAAMAFFALVPVPLLMSRTSGSASASASASKEGKPKVKVSGAQLRALLTPATVTVLCVAFVMGSGMGVVSNYLFLWLEELGGGEVLMGLSLTMTCVSEVGFFLAAPALLRRFGTVPMMNAAFFSYILRLALYALLQDGHAWVVMFVEPLHGCTFAAFWSATVTYMNDSAPPELRATTQTALTFVHFGLGGVLGAVLGGAVYEAHGARVLFAGASAAVGLCALVFLRVKHLVVQAPHASWTVSSKSGVELTSGPDGEPAGDELPAEQAGEPERALV